MRIEGGWAAELSVSVYALRHSLVDALFPQTATECAIMDLLFIWEPWSTCESLNPQLPHQPTSSGVSIPSGIL